MNKLHKILLIGTAVLGLATLATPAQAWVAVRVGVGFPCYRPYWWGPGVYVYPGYPGYPYYAVPPAVVVGQPAPVIVQSATPTMTSPPPAETLPTPTPVPQAAAPTAPPFVQAPTAQTVVQPASVNQRQLDIDHYLSQLVDANDGVRIDALTHLGQLHAVRAIDKLAAVLSGDRSPTVREAAARALGVIAHPKAMPALKYSAQVDPDQFVRHSSQFAIDIINARPVH